MVCPLFFYLFLPSFLNLIDLIDHDGIASACYADCPVTDLARGIEFDARLFSRHKHATFYHDTPALFLGHCFFTC